MKRRQINDMIEAAKKGDYSKLEEAKSMLSKEDYQKALDIFEKYSQKSKEEIISELKRLKQLIPNQDELIQQLLPFLNEEQKSRLDKILEMLED